MCSLKITLTIISMGIRDAALGLGDKVLLLMGYVVRRETDMKTGTALMYNLMYT